MKIKLQKSTTLNNENRSAIRLLVLKKNVTNFDKDLTLF